VQKRKNNRKKSVFLSVVFLYQLEIHFIFPLLRISLLMFWSCTKTFTYLASLLSHAAVLNNLQKMNS